MLPAAFYHLSRSEREKKKSTTRGTAGPQVPNGAVARATTYTPNVNDVRARWELVPLDTLAALFRFRGVTEDVGVALYDVFVCRKSCPSGAFKACKSPTCKFIERATRCFENLGRLLADRWDVLRILRILKATIRRELVDYRCGMQQQPCGYDVVKVVRRLDEMRVEVWAKLEECST